MILFALEIEEESPEDVPALANALGDENADVKMNAAEALAHHYKNLKQSVTGGQKNSF